MRFEVASVKDVSRKVGDTRNWLPYVIHLYKRQERQNMDFEKMKMFWLCIYVKICLKVIAVYHTSFHAHS